MADPAGDADALSEITYRDEIKKTKKISGKKKKAWSFLLWSVPLTWKGKSLYHLQSWQGVVCWLVLLEQGSDGHCGLELEIALLVERGQICGRWSIRGVEELL